MILYLDPLSPHQLKNVARIGPPLTKLSGSAHDLVFACSVNFHTVSSHDFFSKLCFKKIFQEHYQSVK